MPCVRTQAREEKLFHSNNCYSALMLPSRPLCLYSSFCFTFHHTLRLYKTYYATATMFTIIILLPSLYCCQYFFLLLPSLLLLYYGFLLRHRKPSLQSSFGERAKKYIQLTFIHIYTVSTDYLYCQTSIVNFLSFF